MQYADESLSSSSIGVTLVTGGAGLGNNLVDKLMSDGEDHRSKMRMEVL